MQVLDASFHVICLASAVASVLVSLQLLATAQGDRFDGLLRCCFFVVWYCFLNFSAEVSAGSLASKCLFSKHGGTLGNLGSSKKDMWVSKVTFLPIWAWFWDPILKALRAPGARNLVLLVGSFRCPFRDRFLGRNPSTWGS